MPPRVRERPDRGGVDLTAATLKLTELTRPPDAANSLRIFVADGEAGPVAVLSVDEALDRVELAYVEPERRREGLASALLEEARRRTGLELASDSGDRSSDGSAWARAAGLERGGSYLARRTLPAEEAEATGARLLAAAWDYPRED